MNASSIRFSEAPSAMSEAEFMTRFGAVYEHSPWIARRTWQRGLTAEHDTVDGLARALAEHRFNQRATAEGLGLTYDQLRHALKRHELLGAGG